MPTGRLCAALAAIALSAAACGSPAPSDASGTVEVVASTTVFADLASQVAGSAADVTSLVPKGGEVHTFDPRPSDVERIRDSLSTLDPANADTYRVNAARYDQELQALDTTIRADIAALPIEQRKIIAFHDAFPYFAAAYGLEVVGTVVSSPGQDPSAANMARLVKVIRDEHVRAIFTEAQFNPELVQQIGDETGATVEGDLYDDTLGDAPVNSYVGMLRWDADRVVAALK